jgi:chromosome segregation ATPase
MRLIETESLKNDFVQFNVQLEEWRKNYAQKTEEINALRDELKELDTKWKKTLEMEREEPLPEQVMTRINTNLKEITTLNGVISDRTTVCSPNKQN